MNDDRSGAARPASKEAYTQHRFGRTRRGRRLNRIERAVVDRSLAAFPPGLRVMDVPCGDGRMTDLILKHGHQSTAVDHDLKMLCTDPNAPAPALLGSVFGLPFRDGAFDLALVVRLLHWFTADQIERALRELGRVAPRVLLTFYNRNSARILRKRILGHDHKHAKSYSLAQMVSLAGRGGFRVVRRYPRFAFLHQNQFLYLERPGPGDAGPR